ncbi:MAG TPA: GerMN domain-containing protein [Anaerolineaceae bacterium]|nr:GerMN domain-containing protein [Anaerolineaceae bacterium]
MNTKSFLALLLALFVASCTPLGGSGVSTSTPASTAIPKVTVVPPTETSAPPPKITVSIATSAPTAIQQPASIPPTAEPTEIQAPTQPAATATSGSTGAPQMVQIFLIAVGDEGKAGKKVGCGDSVVPVKVEIQRTQGVLRAALQALLSKKDQYYGQSGLYNALYQSDLQVGSLAIVNGKAEIHLTGTLKLGGECDNPRVQAQLEETALQFSTVRDTAIFINDRTLAEALSLK